MTPKQFKTAMAQAAELRAWMVAHGVEECSLGEVAIRVSRAHVAVDPGEPPKLETPEERDRRLAAEKRAYEELLYASSGA